MASYAPDCGLWEFEHEDISEREMIKRGFLKMVNPDSRFAVDFEGGFADINERTTLLVAGADYNAPCAYTRFVNHGKLNEIQLENLMKSEMIGTCDRAVFHYEQNNKYDNIFSQYKGGEVCKISIIESFYPGKGYGTRMIRHLQNKEGVELIYTSASSDAVSFYQKRGFFEMGIKMKCISRKCIRGQLRGCGIWEFIPMAWMKA